MLTHSGRHVVVIHTITASGIQCIRKRRILSYIGRAMACTAATDAATPLKRFEPVVELDDHVRFTL